MEGRGGGRLVMGECVYVCRGRKVGGVLGGIVGGGEALEGEEPQHHDLRVVSGRGLE